MAYKYNPTVGPAAHPDFVDISKDIGGTLHPLRLKAKGFTTTMDAIDAAVEKGASIAGIKKRFADRMHVGGEPATDLVAKHVPAAPAKMTSKEKAAAVAEIAAKYGHAGITPAALVKRIRAAHPHISYANALYLANKHVKNKEK